MMCTIFGIGINTVNIIITVAGAAGANRMLINWMLIKMNVLVRLWEN
jgi:hypothetical protein